jgi:ParB/RepB/Spo0J family partition protein
VSTATDQLLEIPLEQISTRENFNPRTDVEVDDKFVASIKSKGILSPITVVKNGEGYYLLAGERRLAGALIAGLKTMPAIVRSSRDEKHTDADELAAALAENMHRKDLTAVEEARASAKLRELGYSTRRQIAAAMNVPENRVKLYEQINACPEDVQKLLHTGDVPLSVVPTLAQIGDASAELCTVVAEAAVKNRWSAPDFSARWPNLVDAEITRVEDAIYDEDGALRENIDWKKVPKIRFFRAKAHYEPFHFDLTEKATAQLNEAAETSPFGVSIRFEQADVDAANAYGCLVHHEHVQSEHFTYKEDVITDRDWANDRVSGTIIPRMLKKARKDAKSHADFQEKVNTAPGGKPTIEQEAANTGKPVEEIKAERKAEREEMYEAQIAAHSFNQEFGLQVFERLNTVELDNTTADLIVALVLRDGLGDLALRGLRYIHPAYVEEHELKNGRTKLEFVEGQENARKKVHSFVHEASTPQEKLGRICQLVVAAQFADHTCVARSRRAGHQLSSSADGLEKANRIIEEAGDKLVKKLTPKMRQEAARRRAERQKDGAWND